MSLKEGLKQFSESEKSLLSGKLDLHYLQTQLFSIVCNNAPKFVHPSDINHVDRVATRLHEKIELIIYSELESSYIEKSLEVINQGREELKRLYNDYKPKY